MSDAELIGAIEEYVDDFTRLMDVLAEVKCTISTADDENRRVVNITYEGNELGYLIGNRGAHLKGLQYVLSMLINKKFISNEEERLYVNVDVSGYKKSRESKIRKMAYQAADESRVSGEPVDMEPMGASERRIVHMALSKFDDIETESQGESRDRFVRVIPKSEVEIGLFQDNMADSLLDDLEDDVDDLGLGPSEE